MRMSRSLMALIQPETAYFGTEGGTCTSYIFVDLDDPAPIPVIADSER